jgi:biotin carboxyl carrier protein
MTFKAAIGDKSYDVRIDRRDATVSAAVDGRDYELEVSEPEPNIYLLKHGGRIYQVYVPPGKLGEPKIVNVGTAQIEVTLTDPKRLAHVGSGPGAAEGVAEIKTAMPGKVVRVLVDAGETVTSGQGVIVVEAMKMQNELRSPKDGTVKVVNVEEGETVSAGQILLTVE